MNKENILISSSRLMWLMIRYHENISWLNETTLKVIKNPFRRDEQKECAQHFASYPLGGNLGGVK